MKGKLYFKFLIRILAVLIVTFLITSFIFLTGTSYFYYNKMCKSLKEVSKSNIVYNIFDTDKKDADESYKINSFNDTVSLYKGKLGIDENRSFYIIRKENMKILFPEKEFNETMESTDCIKNAVKSDFCEKMNLNGDFFECAYTVSFGDSSYILYLRDNKSDLKAEILYILRFLMLSFIIILVLSFISSFIFSRFVKKPVYEITKRAEGFEKGEIYEGIDDTGCDEFNELVKSVNHMGFVMAESIQRMNADKHKSEVILEHVNNGIMTFDNNQKLIMINSAAKRILNIKNEDDIKFDEFFNDMGIDVKMGEFSYLEKSGTVEKEIKKNDRHIRAFFIPFKIDSERNAGVVCVFEDETEQFNVMTTMKKFVNDVSHELRTPLTIISANTETVLNSFLGDKATTATLLNTVYQEAGKMNELVSNLLYRSKYEAKPRIEEPFSIDEMIDYLVNAFKAEAEKKDLKLTYNRVTDIPEFKGSKGDIERAVKNIISNSIKYTSKGDEIRIFAGKLNNEIYIKVEDTGWGIPENKLPYVFDRFYRVEEESRSRDRGGTGLGLAISKEIIESYGGNIKLESEYTKGTKVTITLPLKKKN